MTLDKCSPLKWFETGKKLIFPEKLATTLWNTRVPQKMKVASPREEKRLGPCELSRQIWHRILSKTRLPSPAEREGTGYLVFCKSASAWHSADNSSPFGKAQQAISHQSKQLHGAAGGPKTHFYGKPQCIHVTNDTGRWGISSGKLKSFECCSLMESPSPDLQELTPF